MAEIEKYRRVDIDESDLSEELCKQAARFIFVAEKYVAAEGRYMAFKTEMDERTAKIDAMVRESLTAEGKKATEKMVEQGVIGNLEYQKMQRQLIRLRTEREMLKALKEAWYMRKDMLIQLAIKQRAELEGLGSEAA
jgi:hypothetical protein